VPAARVGAEHRDDGGDQEAADHQHRAQHRHARDLGRDDQDADAAAEVPDAVDHPEAGDPGAGREALVGFEAETASSIRLEERDDQFI